MHTFTSSSTLLRFVGVALTALFIHASASAQVDPPGRVARLSYANGNLSLAAAGSDQWTDVPLNRPISVGDSLWVPDRGRAELHIGSSAVRLGEQTSLTFLTLSDDTIQLKMTRGTMVVRLRSLTGKEVFEINTPNLAFSLQEAGEYKISVNDDNSTNVVVRRGTAIAYGDRDSVTVREAEQVLFFGTNLSHNSIGRMPPYDTFDQWVNDRDRVEDTSISAQYVSRDVIGYQQLDEYGSWETHAEYGAIWVPRTTEVGWAPYRNGNWLWVAPWGWTWVDRAPWGFAPYHYGRWAHIGPRWCWVPGHDLHRERPVYAPALVAFVGGNGISASLNLTSGRAAGPGVAWFPLAPGEAYRPSYTASSHYLNKLNRTVIINNTIVNNNRQVYINQHVTNAVTAVPTSVFVKGQFVGAGHKPLTPEQLSSAQIGAGAPAIAPSSDSMFGATRRVANPDNGANQYRQRPVVATFRPAEAPVDRYFPRQDGRVTAAGNDPRNNPVDPRTRVTVAPVSPNATVIVPPNIVLHNNGRSDNGERNGRYGNRDDNRDGNRMSDQPSATDRRINNGTEPRRPQESSPYTPVMRAAPEPALTVTPTEQLRRQNVQPTPVRIEEREMENNNRQFNNQRVVPNNQNPVRTEIRRETPTSPPENAFPAMNQRTPERVIAAPREVSRPAQEAVMQAAPRMERPPSNEVRQAAPMPVPAAVARPERVEQKEHKDKPDPRNNLREKAENR